MSLRLKRIRQAAQRLLLGTDDRIEITITDDGTIAELAGRFRGSPHPTDVLAFSYPQDPWLTGEIIISADTAKRQAAERRVPLMDEILLLIVHGLWHVRGQGDETERDWCRMRVLEFETMVKMPSLCPKSSTVRPRSSRGRL